MLQKQVSNFLTEQQLPYSPMTFFYFEPLLYKNKSTFLDFILPKTWKQFLYHAHFHWEISPFSQVKILHSHIPLTACSQFHRVSALLAPVSQCQWGCAEEVPPLRITFTDAIQLYLKGGEIVLAMDTLCLSSLSCQDEEVDEAFGLREDEFLSKAWFCSVQIMCDLYTHAEFATVLWKGFMSPSMRKWP